MEFDLETLNELSQHWDDEVEKSPTAGQLGITSDPVAEKHLMIHPTTMEKGLKILHLYQLEIQKGIGHGEAEASMQNHLYRLGYLHFRQIFFQIVQQDTTAAEEAEKACLYLKASLDIDDDPRCAQVLGFIFECVGFYASAIHWYMETERQVQRDVQFANCGEKARRHRLNLQLEDKTYDPDLGHAFPTSRTAGIQIDPETQARLKYQAEQQQAEQERQLQQAVAEKQQRTISGLCANCGKPLGFVEKVSGKRAHNWC